MTLNNAYFLFIYPTPPHTPPLLGYMLQCNAPCFYPTTKSDVTRRRADCVKANLHFYADSDPPRGVHCVVKLMEQEDVSQRMYDNNEAVSQFLNHSTHLWSTFVLSDCINAGRDYIYMEPCEVV